MDDAEIPAKVVGEPVLFDIFFTDSEIYDYRSSQNSDVSLLNQFNANLLENGILKGSTKFYMSTSHDNEDIEHTVMAFERTLNFLS